jgi:anti-sigma B factor antagonist
MTEPQAVSIRPHDQVVWAVVHHREMDDSATEQVQKTVPAAAAAKPGQPVVLDLSQVEFVPSLALGTLVSLLKSLRQGGHRLLLAGLHPHVRATLAVTRLDKLFEIYPTVDDALKQAGASA